MSRPVNSSLERPGMRSSITCIVALLLFVAPLLAEAQGANRVWRVGVLATANPSVYDDTVDELRRLGYIQGQNLALELRSAEGKAERLPVLAAELVRAGVDVTSREAPKRRFGPLGRSPRRSPS